MKYAIYVFGWSAVGFFTYLCGVWFKASDSYRGDFAAATSASGIGMTMLAAALVTTVLMLMYMHLINAVTGRK